MVSTLCDHDVSVQVGLFLYKLTNFSKLTITLVKVRLMYKYKLVRALYVRVIVSIHRTKLVSLFSLVITSLRLVVGYLLSGYFARISPLPGPYSMYV